MGVAEYEVVQPGTDPDGNRLWQVAQRARMAQLDRLGALMRWRIAADDLMALRRNLPAGALLSTMVDGRPGWQLFGFDVEVVDPARHRWPELVLVVDRRIGSLADGAS